MFLAFSHLPPKMLLPLLGLFDSCLHQKGCFKNRTQLKRESATVAAIKPQRRERGLEFILFDISKTSLWRRRRRRLRLCTIYSCDFRLQISHVPTPAVAAALGVDHLNI
jgi:hypothetical protein